MQSDRSSAMLRFMILKLNDKKTAAPLREYKTDISGWNLYPVSRSILLRPERYSQLTPDYVPLIARGCGRSYGDAAQNSDRYVMLMERLNRMIAFDEETGILRAEAGTTLGEILEIFVPRGWFLPVTPGTKFVTLGGCVAADVHGKNHHRDGTFSKHVQGLDVILADGSKRWCTPKQDSELFWATVGGMGLTGIISEVALQLTPIESAYMVVKHHPAAHLEEAISILSSLEKDDHYSVAWIDCLATGKQMGRSVVMNGHHAQLHELPSNIKDPFKFKSRAPFSIPLFAPAWLLNSWTIKGFNEIYYRMQSRKIDKFIIDYDRYFYPLDAISNWNKLYGKKGFVQYQFVVPLHTAAAALQQVLTFLTTNRLGSFLGVLKKFGKAGEGLLSFPFEGFTLALDIPLGNKKTLALLNALDELVLKHEGRIYLAKDARMKPETFRVMYPRLDGWQRVKEEIDPQNKFSSDLSRRLEMDGGAR